MYQVKRNGDVVEVLDWKGETIYSVPSTTFILYRSGNSPAILSSKVSQLNDEQLLIALAQSVKLSI